MYGVPSPSNNRICNRNGIYWIDIDPRAKTHKSNMNNYEWEYEETEYRKTISDIYIELYALHGYESSSKMKVDLGQIKSVDSVYFTLKESFIHEQFVAW